MGYQVVCPWEYRYGKSVRPLPRFLDVSFGLVLYPRKDLVDTFVGLHFLEGFSFSWFTPISINH